MSRVGIIGLGNLGKALAEMLIRRPDIKVIGSVRRPEHLRALTIQLPEVEVVDNNAEVIANSNVLILAVKPNQMRDVCAGISSHICLPIISVAAAVPLNKLHQWLPHKSAIIRCMPNLPCSIGAGVVPYYSYQPTDDLMQDIFAPNRVIAMDNDAEIDAATVISGCGPAFISWFSDQLYKIGQMRIPDAKLQSMIAQTICGTGLLLETKSSATIMKEVASPKGATEAALRLLQDGAMETYIHTALKGAHSRISDMADKL